VNHAYTVTVRRPHHEILIAEYRQLLLRIGVRVVRRAECHEPPHRPLPARFGHIPRDETPEAVSHEIHLPRAGGITDTVDRPSELVREPVVVDAGPVGEGRKRAYADGRPIRAPREEVR